MSLAKSFVGKVYSLLDLQLRPDSQQEKAVDKQMLMRSLQACSSSAYKKLRPR